MPDFGTNQSDSVETLTNKTIDAKDQTSLTRIYTHPSVRSWGFVRTVNNLGGSYGIMGGCNVTGTLTASMDNTEGNVTSYATGTTANSRAGINAATTNAQVFQRAFNPKTKMRCKIDSTTASRVYVGFTSATTVPASDTPLANTDHGVLVGFRTTDTNWSVFNNDGSGAMVAATLSPTTAKDTIYRTITIDMDNSVPNISVQLDTGTVTTLTTRIPAANTNMIFTIQGQNSTTTGKNFAYVFMEIESKP